MRCGIKISSKSEKEEEINIEPTNSSRARKAAASTSKRDSEGPSQRPREACSLLSRMKHLFIFNGNVHSNFSCCRPLSHVSPRARPKNEWRSNLHPSIAWQSKPLVKGKGSVEYSLEVWKYGRELTRRRSEKNEGMLSMQQTKKEKNNQRK
jgi:hypothetical protein